MARPRKNADKAQNSLLTPDNVVEIPVEEQPYPLPEGWRWVRLESVLSASKEKTEDFSSPSLRYIGLEHFEKDNGITGFASAEGVRSLKNIFHPGQILYGKLRPYLNKHDIADFDGVCSTDILVFNCLSRANNKFINYFFNLSYFQEYAVANSKGINLPRVSEKVILDAVFPLPHLDEQQRIVERIESLFAKLDEAKAKAEAVLDGFEIRKAAILHKAFTGKLTVKWRAKNRVKRTSWENLTLGNVAKWGSGGTPSRKYPEYYTGDIAWVKTGELNNGYLYETEEHITKEAIKNSNAKIFPQGTVIIAMYGATIGQCAILEIAAATNQACACAIVNSNTDNKFLFTYLLSQKHNFINLGKGGAQPNISQTILKEYPIVLPSLPEQQEIVRILDNLLAKEQRAKEAAETVLTQIDLMKKAILARAFRGEMGTHSSARNSLRNNETM